MNAVAPGGLAGKARCARDRNRAARMYLQQVIDEYLDPDHDGRYPRWPVPIGGRSDFLPSALQCTETPESGHAVQLELPLPVSETAVSTAPSTEAVGTTPTGDTAPAVDTVIRFPRSPEHRARPVLKPPQQFRRRREEFTIGGFLAGCAMGTAAAALVLLVVQTVVG